MGDFIIDANDGHFIIESGSNSIPVFKVSGSQTLISGSLVPGDTSATASAELGSEATPWKELYVESASINFIDTKFPVGNSSRKSTFTKADVDDTLLGKPPRGVAPLSRFQQELSFEGRIAAANTWYARTRMRDMYIGTSIATSDPDGTALVNMTAFKARHITAVQNMTINKITLTMLNDRNADNIVFSIFKGTLVNNSNANITINAFGTPFAPTMAYRNNYLLTQSLTSSNTLSAGDFLMFTIHTTSYSSTSYPLITVTLDGQYR